jgi:hypothetical protein
MKHCKAAKLGIILSLVLVIGTTGMAFGAAPSAYWYLDDAQNGPYDDTLTQGSVNDGACVTDIRCPTRLDTGNVGAAQTFDGANDGILVPAAAGADSAFDFQDDGNFSVEVWFQGVTAIPLNTTQVLIGRADSTAGNSMQWWIGVWNNGGTIQVAARLKDQDGDGAGAANRITNTATTPVDVTTAGWHQAILVKNGNDVSLYVDNVPEDTKTIDYTTIQGGNGLTSTAAPLAIGLLHIVTDGAPNESSFFKGDIDQVAIYNQALTADDVNAGYTAGMAQQPLEFAPVFTTIDFGTTALGYEFSTNVNVAANPAVSGYALGTAPADLFLDTTNGDVDWIPTDQEIGAATFNVSATNTLGTTAQDLTVNVVDVCATIDTNGAYWDLNEAAEPFDGRVQGEVTHPDVNDAACIGTGCPTVDGAPKVNGALAFDGSTQGLEVAASAAKDKVFDWAANESFTISLFMKPNLAGFDDGSTEVMLGRWLTGGFQWWIGLRDAAGDGVATPRLYARLEAANGNGDATGIEAAASPAPISDGTWYHVALVYDHDATSGNVRLYIDGVLEAQETIAYDAGTDFADDTNPLNIGYLFTGINNIAFWGGSLDEIAFFDSALDASVLLQHATQNVGRGFCNDAPTITSTPVTTADAGVEYTYAPTASVDAEGDTYTWSLPTQPTGMNIDSTTGAINWTPGNADAAAPVDVTLMVSDGFGGTSTQAYTITVTASDNVAPVITGQTAASIAIDATYTIEVANLTITDPDSTTFTLTVHPGTNYTVSGATVTPDSGYSGDLSVPITVNDGVNESEQFIFVINVGTTTPATTSSDGGSSGGCFIDSSMF